MRATAPWPSRSHSPRRSRASRCTTWPPQESGNAAPSRELAERWFPGTPVADDLGEFESLMSTRKIRERLGFAAEHDWR